MSDIDRLLRQKALPVLDRTTARSLGASDKEIRQRLSTGRWGRPHHGVYLADVTPLTWTGQLLAATLAGGPGSVASHRSASVLWGLEGLVSSAVEITVPYTHGPVPVGVIVHRTRREIPMAEVAGVPVTTIERTLLDLAAMVPPLVLEKAVASAVRLGLTSLCALSGAVNDLGGSGVRGTGKLRSVVATVGDHRLSGSPAEVELLALVRRAGLPQPVLQYELKLGDGRKIRLDFAWSPRHKAVEVDGLDAHSSAEALDDDLVRQNLILAAGWQLRRFSARAVRRRPREVVAEIASFLALP